jgi:two-component sensor histidine kinase
VLDQYLDEVAEAQRRQRLAEEHREMLAHELAHRLKNVIATVQGIAGQTFKGAAMKQHLAEFDGRLRSIAAAQEILLADATHHVDLWATIKSAVAPFEARPGERFTLKGPELKLPSKACVSVALAFHELATNATKYGALSSPMGRVEIFWEETQTGFRVTWSESGGPTVTAPTRRGFGSRMIEQLLAAELSGEVAIRYESQGVQCVIEAPTAD